MQEFDSDNFSLIWTLLKGVGKEGIVSTTHRFGLSMLPMWCKFWNETSQEGSGSYVMDTYFYAYAAFYSLHIC